MSNDILVITEHLQGQQADISYEMVGKARELAGALDGSVTALVMGSGAAGTAGGFASDTTLYVDDPGLAAFNPAACCKVIEAVVRDRQPRLIMCGYTSMGMDIASWLSVALGIPHVAYVNNISIDGGDLLITSRLYGGKMVAESMPDGKTALVSVLAGAWPGDSGKGSTAVDQVASPVALDDLKVRFVRLIEPAGGDVDISAQDKLVAIGRGIESQDNIELAQDLAEALGASLAASRPLVDAGWLPKTRQVGKSGISVRPKLYLMLGISGAPEHVEGMRGADLIIAVNTDANAPIFNVAHYGATADLFDVTEAMLEKLG